MDGNLEPHWFDRVCGGGVFLFVYVAVSVSFSLSQRDWRVNKAQ